jgi:hypothetical protein
MRHLLKTFKLKIRVYELGTKVDCSGEELSKSSYLSHIVDQLYGVPHGILRVFINVLDENEFQNPLILSQTSVIPSNLLYCHTFLMSIVAIW